MKKSEVPQDKSALEHFTREVCYVKNEEGQYDTALSTGWETKKVALDQAWEEIDRRINDAKEQVLKGEASPILYFMELTLMDLSVLAGYTKFWKWQIKKHMKPAAFTKLSEAQLKRYANAFDISVAELTNTTFK
jgi:hypothetical protein